MLQIIRNIGVCLLIAAWMTSCGSKPNNTNNSGVKDLETKEKSLLEELKPFVKDEFVDLLTSYLAVQSLVPPNTPPHEIRKKLEITIGKINDLEQAIKLKKSNPTFKPGKEIEGTKKMLELRKATRKKYELILGIHNPS
jgi:hypothetical protein